MHRFFAGGLGTDERADLEISVPAVLEVVALKTRTEWHRRGAVVPRGKPKGTARKECGWNRHTKRGIGGGTSVFYYGEPGVLCDHGGPGSLYPF